MKCFKYCSLLLLLLWGLGCKDDPFALFPVIQLTENENKRFSFTNKGSAYYLGNSHRENISEHDGWTIKEAQYLRDYRIFLNSKLVHRDSLNRFTYQPFSFVREYIDPVIETFTFIDSLNAIVWEFESLNGLKEFTFEPLLPHSEINKNIRLSLTRKQIIFSPAEIAGEEDFEFTGWMGFLLVLEESDRVIVLAAIEDNQVKLERLLTHLSLNYRDHIKRRIDRIASVLNLNQTYTNIPELTDAVAWAQLSLDALVIRNKERGIWTGLPCNNIYRGKDTFISFAGAFLINGQFEEAREILESFSRHQSQKKSDQSFGRIPNKVNKKGTLEYTADTTWWLIRAAYEYLLYSGDLAFVQKIYPAIKQAIEGAVQNSIDENFFITHEDVDTWMDGKGEDGALVQRGNRAVEIQALWYTALQIGAKLAEINNEPHVREHWLAISETLKENFNHNFWNRYKKRIYDHLNLDGSKDRKIRPNQIFTVSVPCLSGIVPLINEEIRANITSNVLRKLTYRYGVASLWQEDKDFHPWHQHQPCNAPDEAYYNGSIQTWLTGPVVSSLLSFNREEQAFNLYYDEAIQILYDDAIGNYGEIRDALPDKKTGESDVSGTVSYARSLAEFTRNFYQDFIGYQPNALQNQIILQPNFPEELKFASTILPFADSKFLFTYTFEDEIFKFEINRIEGYRDSDIILLFPGYDAVNSKIDENNSSFEIELDPSKRRSYHSFSDLDWYFTQPELMEGLRALQESDI